MGQLSPGFVQRVVTGAVLRDVTPEQLAALGVRGEQMELLLAALVVMEANPQTLFDTHARAAALQAARGVHHLSRLRAAGDTRGSAAFLLDGFGEVVRINLADVGYCPPCRPPTPLPPPQKNKQTNTHPNT